MVFRIFTPSCSSPCCLCSSFFFISFALFVVAIWRLCSFLWLFFDFDFLILFPCFLCFSVVLASWAHQAVEEGLCQLDELCNFIGFSEALAGAYFVFVLSALHTYDMLRQVRQCRSALQLQVTYAVKSNHKQFRLVSVDVDHGLYLNKVSTLSKFYSTSYLRVVNWVKY